MTWYPTPLFVDEFVICVTLDASFLLFLSFLTLKLMYTFVLSNVMHHCSGNVKLVCIHRRLTYYQTVLSH